MIRGTDALHRGMEAGTDRLLHWAALRPMTEVSGRAIPAPACDTRDRIDPQRTAAAAASDIAIFRKTLNEGR
jgi:hypothetical protein